MQPVQFSEKEWIPKICHPLTSVPQISPTERSAVLDLLVKAKLAPSKAEARRLVTQGGVAVDGEKVTEAGAVLSISDFEKNGQNYVVIKKGKKVFHKVILK